MLPRTRGGRQRFFELPPCSDELPFPCPEVGGEPVGAEDVVVTSVVVTSVVVPGADDGDVGAVDVCGSAGGGVVVALVFDLSCPLGAGSCFTPGTVVVEGFVEP